MTAVTRDHACAKIGEFFDDERSTGVMRRNAPVLGRETEGHGEVKIGERFHLAIEPVERMGTKTVRPGEPGAQMAHAEPLHPGDRFVKSMILKMKPLAEAERRGLRCELFERKLR